MARYRKVDIRVWGDERVRRLSVPTPNGRDCWLYLLTAAQSTALPGVIPAGAGAMAETLRWPAEGFREAFREVSREGLAKADWEAGLVWIPKALKYNPPESPNVVIGWGKAFDELPDSELKSEIYSNISKTMEAFGKGFQEAFAKAFGSPPSTLSPALAESGTGTGAVTGVEASAGAVAPPDSTSSTTPSSTPTSKAKTIPDSRHAATIEAFKARFEETHPGATWRYGSADGPAVKRVLAFPEATDEEIARRLDFAFADGWFRAKGTLALFCSRWATWTPTAVARPDFTKGRAPVETIDWKGKTEW